LNRKKTELLKLYFKIILLEIIALQRKSKPIPPYFFKWFGDPLKIQDLICNNLKWNFVKCYKMDNFYLDSLDLQIFVVFHLKNKFSLINDIPLNFANPNFSNFKTRLPHFSTIFRKKWISIDSTTKILLIKCIIYFKR